jgi:hypothetical protein
MSTTVSALRRRTEPRSHEPDFRDAPTTSATRIHWAREELGIDLSLFENAQAWFARGSTRPAFATAMQT